MTTMKVKYEIKANCNSLTIYPPSSDMYSDFKMDIANLPEDIKNTYITVYAGSKLLAHFTDLEIKCKYKPSATTINLPQLFSDKYDIIKTGLRVQFSDCVGWTTYGDYRGTTIEIEYTRNCGDQLCNYEFKELDPVMKEVEPNEFYPIEGGRYKMYIYTPIGGTMTIDGNHKFEFDGGYQVTDLNTIDNTWFRSHRTRILLVNVDSDHEALTRIELHKKT